MATDPATRPSSFAPATGVAPAGVAPAVAGFDLDAAWYVPAQVSIRPERFGALLYHFGTRRLSFLKSPELLKVVHVLADSPTARAACAAAGVADTELPAYRAALATLAASEMIRRRTPS